MTTQSAEKSHKRLSLIVDIYRVFSGNQHEIEEFQKGFIKELEDKFFVKVTSVIDEDLLPNGYLNIVFSIHLSKDFYGVESNFKIFEKEKIRAVETKFGGKVVDIFYDNHPKC